jgi:ABC-type uncharacterized transport system substrate-binding protein
MRWRRRRQLLRAGLALGALGLMPGCGQPRLPWQPPPKVPRIGFLAVGSRDGRQFLIDGLLRGLGELGYEEGRNLLIEYRFSEDRNERLPALAAELPMEQATEFDLAINLGTAEALGLTIPPSVLQQTTEVIA